MAVLVGLTVLVDFRFSNYQKPAIAADVATKPNQTIAALLTYDKVNSIFLAMYQP
jgi:hypothetical protein